MKFLKILSRYLLIQAQMINLKIIALFGFIIPLILSLLSIFKDARVKQGDTQMSHHYNLLKESGFIDSFANLFSPFLEFSASFFDLEQKELATFIIAGFLFGFVLLQIIIHLVWIVFEITLYFAKKKNYFETEKELEEYMYIKIFKKNLNEGFWSDAENSKNK
ncbi:hypothetical protein D3M61_11410 [Aliarcobacter butzleri]|uniref:hypothetical protein n=1 Tax=Aliarcobacter butzleri TaxID=28197 RepID=UPI00102E07D0|nr:hypothetical protein [Aliarcobacter butzleri]RZV12755.1 hypothetical protein D3M61_11410 [Aliarcobacter butzleri]